MAIQRESEQKALFEMRDLRESSISSTYLAVLFIASKADSVTRRNEITGVHRVP